MNTKANEDEPKDKPENAAFCSKRPVFGVTGEFYYIPAPLSVMTHTSGTKAEFG